MGQTASMTSPLIRTAIPSRGAMSSLPSRMIPLISAYFIQNSSLFAKIRLVFYFN